MTLAQTAKAAGLAVVDATVDGFGAYSPVGIIVHHTAGAASGDMPSLGVLQQGTNGVQGPLTQIGLGRSGKVYVVCEAKARHAGKGSSAVLARVRQDNPPGSHGGLNDTDGNPHFIGIEIENTGTGQAYPDEQYAALVTLCAAICKANGWTANRVIGHKENTDRKIDPRGIGMTKLRAQVAAAMEEDDMTEEQMVRLEKHIDSRLALVVAALEFGHNKPGDGFLPDTAPSWTAPLPNLRALVAAHTDGATLSDADVARIVKAVNDDAARRAQA